MKIKFYTKELILMTLVLIVSFCLCFLSLRMYKNYRLNEINNFAKLNLNAKNISNLRCNPYWYSSEYVLLNFTCSTQYKNEIIQNSPYKDIIKKGVANYSSYSNDSVFISGIPDFKPNFSNNYYEGNYIDSNYRKGYYRIGKIAFDSINYNTFKVYVYCYVIPDRK